MAADTYRDPARSVSERADDVLARMTLDEKLAQLGGVWITVMLGASSRDVRLRGAFTITGETTPVTKPVFASHAHVD